MGGGVASGGCPGVCVAVGEAVGRGVAAVAVGGIVTGGAEGVDVALSPAGEDLWTGSGGVAGVVAGAVGGSVGGTAWGAVSPQAERAITPLRNSPKVAGGMTRRGLKSISFCPET